MPKSKSWAKPKPKPSRKQDSDSEAAEEAEDYDYDIEIDGSVTVYTRQDESESRNIREPAHVRYARLRVLAMRREVVRPLGELLRNIYLDDESSRRDARARARAQEVGEAAAVPNVARAPYPVEP